MTNPPLLDCAVCGNPPPHIGYEPSENRAMLLDWEEAECPKPWRYS